MGNYDLSDSPVQLGDNVTPDKLGFKLEFDAKFDSDPNALENWRPDYAWNSQSFIPINDEGQGYPNHFDAGPSGFKAVSIENGICHIRCQDTQSTDRGYARGMPQVSGMLSSQSFYDFPINTMLHVRAKLPIGKLGFPCPLWAQVTFPYGTWPHEWSNKKLPEIDVVECLTHTGKILYFTCHSNMDCRKYGSEKSGEMQLQFSSDFDHANDFHDFATLYSDDWMIWLIDWRAVFICPTPDDFKVPGMRWHLYSNLAYNSSWSRSQWPLDQQHFEIHDIKLPMEMKISHIKTYRPVEAEHGIDQGSSTANDPHVIVKDSVVEFRTHLPNANIFDKSGNYLKTISVENGIGRWDHTQHPTGDYYVEAVSARIHFTI